MFLWTQSPMLVSLPMSEQQPVQCVLFNAPVASFCYLLPDGSVSAEIIMFEGLTCVYKSNVDLFFYVIGSSNENEVRCMCVCC